MIITTHARSSFSCVFQNYKGPIINYRRRHAYLSMDIAGHNTKLLYVSPIYTNECHFYLHLLVDKLSPTPDDISPITGNISYNFGWDPFIYSRFIVPRDLSLLPGFRIRIYVYRRVLRDLSYVYRKVVLRLSPC